jgi:hypothetical protein
MLFRALDGNGNREASSMWQGSSALADLDQLMLSTLLEGRKKLGGSA